MQESLFDIEESFNLKTLEEDCAKAVQKRFKPTEGESAEEFNKEFHQELQLEKAARLRVIADQLEARALKEQKDAIHIAYRKLEQTYK